MELRKEKKIYYVLLVPNNLKLRIDCSIYKNMKQEIKELEIIQYSHYLLYSYTIPEHSNNKKITFKCKSDNYSFSSREITIDPHKNNFLFNITFTNESFFFVFWGNKKEFNPKVIPKTTMYYLFHEYVINQCKDEEIKNSLNSDLLEDIISEMLTWEEIEIEFYLDLIVNAKTKQDLYTLLLIFSLETITISKHTTRLKQLVLNAISLIKNQLLKDNLLSEYEGEEKEKLEKCINAFILSIYNLQPTELENYIMCHKNKASIIPVIIHPNFILSKKIISLLLKECNMVAQFIPLLSKAKNINDFLDIIKNNEALFEKYGDESGEEELDIEKMCKREKDDNISLLLQDMLVIYKMKEKNKKLKYIKIEPSLLYDYIDFFENELDKLNEIRKEAEVINQQMNMNLVHFIHRLIFSIIKVV